MLQGLNDCQSWGCSGIVAMSDSSPKVPEIIKAPSSPLWFDIGMWAGFAIFIGLSISFGFVLRDHLRVDEVVEVFRKCRKPLIQYRLEKEAWPASFDLKNPPADVQPYNFSAAIRRPMENCAVPGTWRFVADSSAGKDKAFVVFEAADSGVSTRRILQLVDERLDDGVPDRGKFIINGNRGTFTLKGE